MYGNGFHVPNDPVRTAALNMAARPQTAPSAPVNQQAPTGGGGQFAALLAQATAALTAEGMTPANQSALQQFALVLQKLAEPFTGGGQQGQATPPPVSFGSLPSQSAQAAVPFRGPLA